VLVGDRVFVNRFIYGVRHHTRSRSHPFAYLMCACLAFRRVARGDVIVFDWPGPRDQVEKPTQTCT